MSSATPDAERTPPEPAAGSSAGSRLSFWHRDPVVAGPGELDEEQAAEVVRRSVADLPAEVVASAEPIELDARRAAAEAAAAAATERVIAQALATGLTDPDEVPEVRRGLLRRKSGYYSPAAARPVVGAAAATTDEMREAVAARTEAERSAREHAVQARTEAQRREVAEQLASETAEQAAVANAARAEAEAAALRATLEREAAEARARAQAEAAERALAERSAAEVRAQELAASLEETRAALLEQTKATLAAQQVQASAPAPVPARPPAPEPAGKAVPDPKIHPDGVPDVVEFRSPSSSAVITVLLGLGALVAAAIAVYEAYLDRLTTPSGLTASAVTLVLVVVVGRSRSAAGQVWLDHGVLHVEEGDSHRRFDLTTPTTMVEMVGRPGSRRWKVLFLRKGMAPYEVTAGLVDPEPFVEAIRPYRPRLGQS